MVSGRRAGVFEDPVTTRATTPGIGPRREKIASRRSEGSRPGAGADTVWMLSSVISHRAQRRQATRALRFQISAYRQPKFCRLRLSFWPQTGKPAIFGNLKALVLTPGCARCGYHGR